MSRVQNWAATSARFFDGLDRVISAFGWRRWQPEPLLQGKGAPPKLPDAYCWERGMSNDCFAVIAFSRVGAATKTSFGFQASVSVRSIAVGSDFLALGLHECIEFAPGYDFPAVATSFGLDVISYTFHRLISLVDPRISDSVSAFRRWDNVPAHLESKTIDDVVSILHSHVFPLLNELDKTSVLIDAIVDVDREFRDQQRVAASAFPCVYAALIAWRFQGAFAALSILRGYEQIISERERQGKWNPAGLGKLRCMHQALEAALKAKAAL